jgi:hypothetical protein
MDEYGVVRGLSSRQATREGARPHNRPHNPPLDPGSSLDQATQPRLHNLCNTTYQSRFFQMQPKQGRILTLISGSRAPVALCLFTYICTSYLFCTNFHPPGPRLATGTKQAIYTAARKETPIQFIIAHSRPMPKSLSSDNAYIR